MHFRFIYRQITSSLKQTIVFIACVTLSLVTLVSLGGFGESVSSALLKDSRKLLAGDLIVKSGFPFQDSLQSELTRLANTDGIEVARTYEFISIVRNTLGDKTLLSELKAVESGYPFYGDVVLQSGKPFAQVVKKGQIVVAQNLLDRMDLKVGDDLEIGSATVKIADIVLSESDQPVDFFNIGPRVFLSADDLPATGLIKLGSRVTYKSLLKIADDTQIDAIASQLSAAADPRQVQVDTFRTNQSAVQRFYEQFLTYLSLIGIFTLLLAGIGIQSSLGSFIREREGTIAILRTFGATGRFIMVQFYGVASILGLIGTIIGLGLSIALQWVFPALFGPLLPPQVKFILSARSMIEGVVLGIFVVTIFTFLPIYFLQKVKPQFIFRKDLGTESRSGVIIFAQGIILLFLGGMTYRYLQNVERTAYFTLGMVGLVFIITIITRLILFLLKRQKIKSLEVRQAVRGLFRPRNATVEIIVTLSASLAVLFSIFLIQRNLNTSFVQVYPEDAPNVILLDIQPDQRESVRQVLGGETEFIPIIRARVQSINGTEIPHDEDSNPTQDRGPDPNQPPKLDNLFSLTYRDNLVSNESLVQGGSLFNVDSSSIAQVSINEALLQAYPFKLGDLIRFDIQGVALDAQITSVRGIRNEDSSFAPVFNFVLREKDLVNAPQTIIAAANIPHAEVSDFQNRLVRLFPNITVINISDTIRTLAKLLADITTIIRFFMLFSIAAGMLIIISSVLATRFARIQESVYYKVLGAKQNFVLRVFALENVFIGFVSAFLALLLSQLASWLLITQIFDLSFHANWGSSILLMLFTVILVTLVGLLASISILQKKPITFLRENSVE